jgi:hypothetical protein
MHLFVSLYQCRMKNRCYIDSCQLFFSLPSFALPTKLPSFVMLCFRYIYRDDVHKREITVRILRMQHLDQSSQPTYVPVRS